jgi:hypothetical protein
MAWHQTTYMIKHFRISPPLLICLRSRFQLDFRLAGLTALQEGRSSAPSSGDDGGPALR